MFQVGALAVWKSQWTNVFENTMCSAAAVTADILSGIQCTGAARENAAHNPGPVSCVPWRRPDIGKLKINVDAATGRDGSCAATIARDHRGQVISVSAARITK